MLSTAELQIRLSGETFQTVRGPCECATPIGDEVCGNERVIDSVDFGNCKPAVDCNEDVCVLNDDECTCDEVVACDTGDCPDYFYEYSYTRDVTVCGDPLSCNDSFSRFSSENVKCVGTSTGQGGSLLINASTDLDGMDAAGGSDLLQCSDNESNVYQGDALCPLGFDYLSSKNVCEKRAFVCDFGSPDNLDNGCDNLTTGSDYWGLYNKDCVFNTSSSLPSHVYDDACCYDTSFNNLDIYQNDEADTVRVY